MTAKPAAPPATNALASTKTPPALLARITLLLHGVR